LNLLLTTVFLLLAIAPGFVLNRFYNLGKFSRKYQQYNLSDELTKSAIPGLFLHIIAILFINSYTTYCVNFAAILDILSPKGKANVNSEALNQKFNNFLAGLLYYYGSLLPIAALIGFGARWLIIKLKLDIRFPLFKFSNHWYYLFERGAQGTDRKLQNDKKEKASLREILIPKQKRIDLVKVVALTKVSDEVDVLYSGNLVSYEMGPNNSLYCIYLEKAKREPFYPDRKEDIVKEENKESNNDYIKDLSTKNIKEKEHTLRNSDLFVISGKEIINISVDYVFETPKELSKYINRKPKTINQIRVISFRKPIIESSPPSNFASPSIHKEVISPINSPPTPRPTSPPVPPPPSKEQD